LLSRSHRRNDGGKDRPRATSSRAMAASVVPRTLGYFDMRSNYKSTPNPGCCTSSFTNADSGSREMWPLNQQDGGARRRDGEDAHAAILRIRGGKALSDECAGVTAPIEGAFNLLFRC